MRRREVIGLLACTAAWPFDLTAQQTRRTVAVLMPYPHADIEVRGRVAAFREELRRPVGPTARFSLRSAGRQTIWIACEPLRRTW